MYQYTLQLYKNTSENTDVQKNISDRLDITGYSRESVDILHPVIQLKDYVVNEYNYCYIVELRRYYYITNIVSFPNGTYQLTMAVDVLMSYINDIKASSGLITKQRDYNPYATDYDIESRTELRTIYFPDGNKFDYDGEFVLVALRG